jgi:hypothetical protein
MRKARNAIALGWVAGALLLGSACAPPAAAPEGQTAMVELNVDRSQQRAGGEIRLTLTNRSSDLIGYNLCVAALDRLEGEEWVEVPERPAEVCTMELRTLAPGGSDTFPHTLPRTLAPGVYRFRTGVESPLGESQVGLTSGRFEVVQ